MPYKKICKNCDWWLGDDESLFGECTRFPRWTETKPHHYCGEYRLSIEKKKNRAPAKPKVDYKPIFEAYGSAFYKKYKTKWTGSAKAANQLIKLAKSLGTQQACVYIEAFFKDPPAWNKEKNAFSPGALLACQDNFEIHKAKNTGKEELDRFIILEARKSNMTPTEKLEYFDYVRKSGKKITVKEWLGME